jgi:two-component SAPR family response regulator
MGDIAKILILEDDENLRTVLAKVLRDEGYDVTAVERGEAAVQKASQESFDLMIADIRMEGMDGLEAIERTQNLQPNIGSLVVSGYASEQDTARAERLQVGGYLTKPFKMRDLLKYVREQLKVRGAEPEGPVGDQFVNQALDWSFTALAKTFDEAKTFQGSLLRASRTAEAVCHHIKLSSQRCLAARWATIALGSSRLPGLEIPEFVLQPNSHYPEFTTLLRELTQESDSEELNPDTQAVQLSLEVELDSAGEYHNSELSETYPLDLLEAFQAVQSELSTENELPLEVRLGLGQPKKSQSSLLVLAKTFERSGDLENAKRAFQSLWEDTSVPRWRLEGALGLARLAAQSRDSEPCRGACLSALKVAKELGPSALAIRGLEAALWLQSVQAEETEKALQLVARATSQIGLRVPQALLKLCQEQFGGERPGEDDIRALTALSAANDLERYVSWLLPYLFAASLKADFSLGAVLIRVAQDFPRDFLRAFDASVSPDEERNAVGRSLLSAKYLPDAVVQALEDDPLASIKEFAGQIRSQTEGGPAQNLVRVYSFGNLEVVSRGEAMDEKLWKTRKVKFLFCILASEWGHGLTSDVLIETFWPKENTRKKKNLYWAITALRRFLREAAPEFPEPILRESDTVSLAPDFPRWHDLEEFEKAAASTVTAFEAKKFEAALAHGRMASRLYRGNFLEGCYYDFAVLKRESLSRTLFDVLRKSARAALELDYLEEALEHASRAVDEAPFRQEGHALKMRAHIRLNQAAQAIRQFQDLEKLLRLEFDIEPATELLELFHRARLGFTDA